MFQNHCVVPTKNCCNVVEIRHSFERILERLSKQGSFERQIEKKMIWIKNDMRNWVVGDLLSFGNLHWQQFKLLAMPLCRIASMQHILNLSFHFENRRRKMSKDHKGTSEFCALTTTSKDEGSTLKEQMHSCDCDEWLSKHHLLFRFCSNEGRKMSAKQILAFETKLQCVIVSEGIWTVDHFWTCQWSSWCKVNCAMMQISSSGNVKCWWTKSLHPQSWDKAAQWQPEDDNQRMTSNVLSGWCEAGLEKHQLFWQMCLPQWFALR